MSARGAWDHRQVDSDVAEHRATVLLHLAAITTGPQQVTAAEMAADHPELPVDRWLGVLTAMAKLGRAGESSRMLYVVDLGAVAVDGPTGAGYALGMAGWAAARRLTASESAA